MKNWVQFTIDGESQLGSDGSIIFDQRYGLSRLISESDDYLRRTKIRGYNGYKIFSADRFEERNLIFEK